MTVITAEKIATKKDVNKIASIPKDKIYYIDEMGARMNLILNDGRAPSHEQVYDTKPVSA